MKSLMPMTLRNMILLLLAVMCVATVLAPQTAHANANQRIPNFANYEDRANDRWSKADPTAQGGVHDFLFMPGFSGPGVPIMDVGGKTVRIVDPDNHFVKNVAFTSICPEGSFTERVVRCVTTVIKESVNIFLSGFSVALKSYVMACIILAVTLFGVSILAGTCQNPGSEAFVLLLKISGVLLFTNNTLGGFVDYIFGIGESFASYATSYLATSEGQTYKDFAGNTVTVSSFITGCGSGAMDAGATIWARIDCIMTRLFIGDPSTGLGTGVLWILAVAIFWTSFLGPFIFMMMMVVFGFLGLLVIRCVFVFLSCYAILALLIIMAPLMIPLLLFNSSKIIFDSWLKMVFGMMLQPMVLFFFMVFFFAVLDTMFFQDNEYSLTAHLGPGWEEVHWGAIMPPELQAEELERYTEESGNAAGTPPYETVRHRLSRASEISSVGNARIEPEPLFNIEIFPMGEDENEIPVIGEVVEAAKGVLNSAFKAVQKKLSPFEVPRLQSHVGHSGTLMANLLKFFLLAMILIYLMMKFAESIPHMVARLAGAKVTMPGALMPVERQLKGTVYAVRHAVKDGAVEAVKGFLTGGKKGAIAGAVQGVMKGAQSGYEKGSQQRLSRANPLAIANKGLSQAKSDATGSNTFSDGFKKGLGSAGGGGGKAAGAKQLLTKFK